MEDFSYYSGLIIPILKKQNIEKASIFGSVAKGTAGIHSDLDVLITPGDNFTIFNVIELEEELKNLLKCKVDIVEHAALKFSIRQEALSSAISIL
jgi:predicted nucleotidyltransferase